MANNFLVKARFSRTIDSSHLKDWHINLPTYSSPVSWDYRIH